MNPYLILTIIGIIVKIWATYRLRQSWHFSFGIIMYFIFLILAYAQSILELYGYYLLQYPQYNQLLSLKLYYILASALLLIMPLLHAALLGNIFNKKVTILCAAWFGTLTFFILYTDYIVADVSALPYMLTRVKGQYHAVYNITVLVALFFSLQGLIKIYQNTQDDIKKIKAGNLLIAFVPITLVIILILLLMAIGLPITATGIAPILLGIYILIFSETFQNSYTLDLMSYLPWTTKAKQIRTITKPLRIYTKKPDTCKDLPDEYKTMLIDIANDMFDKQKDAAVWLGISESKMSRLMKNKKQQKD